MSRGPIFDAVRRGILQIPPTDLASGLRKGADVGIMLIDALGARASTEFPAEN